MYERRVRRSGESPRRVPFNGVVDPLAARACELAASLLAASREDESRRERRRRARLARLLADPDGKRFTLTLTDQVVRFHDRRRAARRFRDLVSNDGTPSFLGPLDRLALLAGARMAPWAPGVVLPLLTRRLRRESEGVVLAAEERPFSQHVARRRAEGVHLNVNVLGEAVLGEEEATRRRDAVLARLARPDVDYVSVKVSAVCSQLNVLAFDAEVERVADKLRPLFVEAGRHRPATFVNLDMEEYRDLHLTTAVFRTLLDEPPLAGLDAGIVLQAYLPDSYDVMVELCEWARQRRSAGGGRVKVRLVKGANLAMEQVEAELKGWPQAPFDSKAEVDANYKRLLDVALEERFADAVRVGVASHNLFDVAWALVLRDEHGVADRVEIEMLEGMADPQARATRRTAGGILLYAPVVRRHDFESAIAYLVRRLDENTGPENFLRAAFSLTVGSPEWEQQRARFLRAVEARHAGAGEPRRRQDRRLLPPATDPEAPFENEPDTDFSLPANRTWIEEHLRKAADAAVDPVPLVDDVDSVERAVAVAMGAGKEWAARPLTERRRILTQVADVMAAHRGETLATMAREAGKTVLEGDPEVSEACDFARYYGSGTRMIEALAADGISFEPLGTVVVASPWNFPYAIPAGGVLAALAAGNAVILKPAPETVRTASLVARHCWEAGVSRDVLQFLPCPDNEVGRRLVTHPDVDAVVLTGAYETARLFLDWKPDLRLLAETSGKNAVVVTAAADLDAAVRDVVQSAFGHAGQKCSAASLAIVEASVYDDPAFRRRLADAVTTLAVGPAWDLRTSMGPLVHPPSGPLADALNRLEEGEEWLVAPRLLHDGTGCLWTPGVKLGVRPGSAFHVTECFGPVLGIMRARDLDQAIEWQNATAFGLTGGIHSLDADEVARWVAAVEVGNAYVNRGITGAVVRRQPFGGWKRSVVGPAAKAGGPNYLLSLGRARSSVPRSIEAVEASMAAWWAAEFAVEHDPVRLRAERNLFRYRPLPRGVLVRAGADVPAFDLEVATAAARAAGVKVTVAAAPVGSDVLATVDCVRLLGEVDVAERRALHAAGISVDDTPVVPHGRIELLRWVREQVVSETRHRHGNPLD